MNTKFRLSDAKVKKYLRESYDVSVKEAKVLNSGFNYLSEELVRTTLRERRILPEVDCCVLKDYGELIFWACKYWYYNIETFWIDGVNYRVIYFYD